MYSTTQRLNHLASISTTFVMVLLGLIAAASFLTQPEVEGGKLEVHDLVVCVPSVPYVGFLL
jgi:signal peptidase complex subunit 3